MVEQQVALSPKQLTVVNESSDRCLISCPGSGKTRTIVAKVLVCVDEVRDTSRRVACITYTNAAVYEIEGRLRGFQAPGDDNYYTVSTIHSFCLNGILSPFRHLLPELAAGFQLISPEDDFYRTVVSQLVRDFGLKGWVIDQFASIHRKMDETLFVPDGISRQAAERFVEILDQNKFITLGDIVYFSWKVASQNGFVARGLAARYAWFLIDEFQDTSELQVELLKLIFAFNMSRAFFVGDPNQSIMGFAGARPDLMPTLANQIGAKADIHLTGNHRSSARIVRVAELLCPTNPAMVPVGKHRNYPFEPEFQKVQSVEQAALGIFLPEVQRRGLALGETAILAPQWPTLFHLARQLRTRGFPVVGPGARPYKRSLDFAQFAECVCAYLESRDSADTVKYERALFTMILNLSGEARYELYSYVGKQTIFELLSQFDRLRHESKIAIRWIQDAAMVCMKVLLGSGYLTRQQAQRIIESGDAMVRGIIQTLAQDGKKPESMSIDELGIFANPSAAIHLMTLHASKGREYDAVAIVDLNEGKLPHWSANDDEGLGEARRLLYVGMTRARKILMLFSDTSPRAKGPTRFLGEPWLQFLN